MSNKGEQNEINGEPECELTVCKMNDKSENHLNYDNILDHIGKLGRYTIIVCIYC